MDALLSLVFLVVGLIIVLPIVLLARTRKLKRESATRDEVSQLTRRVFELEKTVQQLHHALTERLQQLERSGGELGGALPSVPTTTSAATAVPSVAEAIPPATAHAVESTPVAKPAAVPPAPPAPAVPLRQAAPSAPPAHFPSTGPGFVPTLLAGSPSTAQAREPRRLVELEERLGANWLNKLGTVALVIGVALLLNYSMHYFGPRGKTVLAYGLAAGLGALGVVGERRERYRIAARAVLGGGWAIAYFTTYAIHNVAAVHLVESPTMGFLLLFGVAAAMVAHSLRYNSELATGFAYLLGFASVAVSRMTLGTLVASAALVASLTVVLWRRRWYALEPLAIVASYAVHWLWLRQVFEAIGSHRPFPEFKASAALLTLYWLFWMASYFLREDRDENAHRFLTASFLLNAGGYLAVLRYQSVYPELRFWFLLGAGAVYLALSPLGKRLGRRAGFVLTSTFGAVLLAAAIPYRYSGARLELLWLAEAEAFLVAGWRLAEAHLRKLGWATAGALTIYVAVQDLAPRLTIWRPPDAAMGWMLVGLAAGFYLNARAAPRLLREHATEIERLAADCSYGAGTGFLLAAAWLALPFMWVALAWAAVGVALNEIGRLSNETVLRGCGHGAAGFAAVRLLVINLNHTPAFRGIGLRLLTVALAAALFYFSSRRIAPAKAAPDTPAWLATAMARHGGLPAAYTWAASLLMALLLWNEVTNAAVGLSWALFGLVLVEFGRAVADRPLRAQGHALLLLSFFRIFIADLNATQRVGPVSSRLLTVSLLVAIYYYAAFTSKEDTPRLRPAFFWSGIAALAALLRFELPIAWVAVGWAGLVVATFVSGKLLGVATMRHQSYLLVLLVGARCAFDNFYQIGQWGFTNLRSATVVAASALLYPLLAATLRERHQKKAAPASPPLADRMRALRKTWRWFDLNPHHLFFFVPTILLTVLVSLEVRKGYLTAAWGLEAVFVFAATLPLGERAFRWFSLALLLLCVGRIVSVDVWALDPLGRIISFLALGAALLLVSFLYVRYRDLLLKYL